MYDLLAWQYMPTAYAVGPGFESLEVHQGLTNVRPFLFLFFRATAFRRNIAKRGDVGNLRYTAEQLAPTFPRVANS